MLYLPTKRGPTDERSKEENSREQRKANDRVIEKIWLFIVGFMSGLGSDNWSLTVSGYWI
ncbi:hypothetical protein FRX31_013895 [Thalictrum thalictroides]|uniref:Uncharacterized protein n=1 Tax=Thalictrum thalictroides TaxID=46969 RepID=A0A7J6WHY4_THATH|nr:hypothetical protein FRX31_013895 [Thalictrum thalictroides]